MTGLYYFNARWYDQDVGRFISEDPLWGIIWDPQSLNRFAYGRNNPYRYKDKTGKSATTYNAWDKIMNIGSGGGGGAVVGGATGLGLGEILRRLGSNDEADINNGSFEYREGDIPTKGTPGSIIGGRGGSREYNQKGKPGRDYDPDVHTNPDGTKVGPGHTHEWGPEGRSNWANPYDPTNPSDRALKEAHEKAKKLAEEGMIEDPSDRKGSGDGDDDDSGDDNKVDPEL